MMKKKIFWTMIGAFLLAGTGLLGISCDDNPPGADENPCITEAFNPSIGSNGTYGSSQTDAGVSIQTTHDDGYVVAGYTWASSTNTNLGPTNYWVMKFDAARNLVWSKVYGLLGREYPYGIYETADNGFVVVGHRRLQEGDELDYDGTYHDSWILKLNSDGNLLWEKTFGARGYEIAHAVQQTKDGGYIVAGIATSYGLGSIESGLLLGEAKKNAWVMKLDQKGDSVWEYVYGGVEEEGANAVQETSDGHFIVAGYESSTNGNGDYNFLVLKLNASGQELWHKTYGGAYPEMAYAIRETTDGNYAMAGETWSFGNGNTDAFVVKTDPNGNELWSTTFGGEKFERAHGLREMPDGSMVVAGYTNSYGAGGNDGLVLKLDTSGNILWQKIIGWDGYDVLMSIDRTSDNGLVLTGTTSSHGAGQLDLWLIHLSSNGEIN